jgi:rhodanese-related sulfurtransferase
MADISRITVEEVRRRLDRGERILFLDTRNAEAWDSAPTKLPGAIRVPAAEVRGHVDELPRNVPIVTYCT